jgi:hypothetical protein
MLARPWAVFSSPISFSFLLLGGLAPLAAFTEVVGYGSPRGKH